MIAPIFGLTESIRVQSIAQGISEFGMLYDYYTTNISTLKCRITLYSKDKNYDLLTSAGRDALKTYKVFCEYAPEITENTRIIVDRSTSVSGAGSFEVFHVKHQQNEYGVYHHTTFYMEKT